jgi:hypothetical protein
LGPPCLSLRAQKVLFKVVNEDQSSAEVIIQIRDSKGNIVGNCSTQKDGSFIYYKCCKLDDVIYVNSDLYFIAPIQYSKIKGKYLTIHRLGYAEEQDLHAQLTPEPNSENLPLTPLQVKESRNLPNRAVSVYRKRTAAISEKESIEISVDTNAFIFVNNKRITELDRGWRLP